jgi:hypothetical protein
VAVSMQKSTKHCIPSTSSEKAAKRRHAHVNVLFDNPASSEIYETGIQHDMSFLALGNYNLESQDDQCSFVDDLHMLITDLNLDLHQGKDIPGRLVPTVGISNAGIKLENSCKFESPIRKISNIAISMGPATIPPPKPFQRSKYSVINHFLAQP